MRRQITGLLIIASGCSSTQDGATEADASCTPATGYRLNVERRCLEEASEIGCASGGCDAEEANAVDEDGNCYRMLGCAPVGWLNSVEDELPDQCAPLSFSQEPPIEFCSEKSEADAGCKPAKGYRLNIEQNCLEDASEIGCASGGCDAEEANAVDEDGNCYLMLGCAPIGWLNSVEDDLPEQCAPLSFAEDPPLEFCSEKTEGDAG